MASSSSTVRKLNYDVFLSFTGKDTRTNFVDHLYTALQQRGIRTFKDDEKLEKGKSIAPELLKAIEESEIAVVVFSQNYASSSWCLDELVKIMECQKMLGQRVYPVFYHVDPSDVRKQKRSYDTAFAKHELEFGEGNERVKKWREALTAAANLSGLDVANTANGREAECVRQIIWDILRHLNPYPFDQNLLGMESHVQKLKSLLGTDSSDVRMIGIWGMGGIGKTTIARAIFRQICYEFEGSSFVEDVRENVAKHGPKSLQKKVISDILMDKQYLKVNDCEDQIRYRLRNKKVLLVLDDVNKATQLEFLAAHEWFGRGSRIIVTTRDEHLLSGAQEKYKPELLHKDETIELLRRHAFKKSSPEGYEELLERAVHYAGNLPLAVKVVGSLLCDREMTEWKSVLDKLHKVPNNDIQGTLKLSFDELDDYEQKLFLDIACFFRGWKRSIVTTILDSFGFSPVIGISVLIEKSLLTYSNGILQMHDLIQEMGWRIVRKSLPNSRLWLSEETSDAVTKATHLEDIEGIKLDDAMDDTSAGADLNFMPPLESLYFFKTPNGDNVDFGSGEVFRSMKNLRLLLVDNDYCKLCSKPTYLPDELRWLQWKYYPFDSLPPTGLLNLVGLDMKRSNIKQLWKEQRPLRNLKLMDLSYSRRLTSFPDVSGAPNLERLILKYCSDLVKLHPSVGALKQLVYLDLTGCSSLRSVPFSMGMKALKTLLLSGCDSLERFPDISGERKRLSKIHMEGCTKIEEVPASVRFLTGLTFLDISSYNLHTLPSTICELKRLKVQRLSPRPSKQDMDFGTSLPFRFLRKLSLHLFGFGEDDFDSWTLHALSSLDELDLSDNHYLINLPATISHISQLKVLNVNDCYQLKELKELPSAIQVLMANNCKSLEKIENLSERYEWLYKISLRNCQQLLKYKESESYLAPILMEPLVQKCAVVNHRLSIAIPGCEIPDWFREKQRGNTISLKLPPNWRTQIMGIAISGVFERFYFATLGIKFKIANDAEFSRQDHKSYQPRVPDVHQNVWIGYISFDFFREHIYHEVWSLYENYLVIHLLGNNERISFLNCGARIVYKEDVERMTLRSPISDYENIVQNRGVIAEPFKLLPADVCIHDVDDDGSSKMVEMKI